LIVADPFLLSQLIYFSLVGSGTQILQTHSGPLTFTLLGLDRVLFLGFDVVDGPSPGCGVVTTRSKEQLVSELHPISTAALEYTFSTPLNPKVTTRCANDAHIPH
jgi:hypothetical protein